MDNNPHNVFNISEHLVKDLLKNQRRDRLWRNLRFFSIILFLFVIIFVAYQAAKQDSAVTEPEIAYVSLIRLSGEISADSQFSAKNTLRLLQPAFADKHAKGVVIDINSGGGSPVQSSIIQAKINQLKHKYHKKVVIVGEDLLASGAYLVAMGGDKIYVNADTITGSIGVIMAGFGFTDLIEKVGVTRRVYTAGENKHRLDAFKPVTAADKAKIEQILTETHQDFMNIVKKSRGDRLKGDPKQLFSGDFWTGTTAVKLGLVDGIGNLSDVLPREFNVNHYVDYSEQPGLLELLLQNIQTSLKLPLSSYHSEVVSAELS